ncbi:MAG TPA: DinB family protein [Gemmatimonadales bacterium]|nr:DinB family protein [Gemmatimonadales bacterium]
MEIRAAAPFATYWEGIRGRTRRVVEVIPPDRIEWSPAAGRWTLGDIVRHLAGIERDMYAENVQGHPTRYPGHGHELAEGKEAVLAYLDRKHAEALEIFRALTPEQLESKCQTPAGTPITTWKWLRAMVEHESHHRGQLYFMLGLLGVPTPPIFGLTEEEVKARSATRSSP